MARFEFECNGKKYESSGIGEIFLKWFICYNDKESYELSPIFDNEKKIYIDPIPTFKP